MFKHSFSLAMSLWVAVSVYIGWPGYPPITTAQAHTSHNAYQTILVENTAELEAAIGSNRTIVLKPNTYVLSKKQAGKISSHLIYNKETGGPIIQNVHNLTLMGTDVRATKVLIAEPFAHVLAFENSHHIRIQSLELGHIPQSTVICLGAVLAFADSTDIQIENVNLFGSGTFGLWLENTQYLTLNNAVIKECSQGVAFISDSTHINLKRSVFVNNAGGVNIWGKSDVVMQRCRMTHNQAQNSRDYSKALFFVKDQGSLVVSDSYLTHNSAVGLVEGVSAAVHFYRNYMHYNRFDTPLPEGGSFLLRRL